MGNPDRLLHARPHVRTDSVVLFAASPEQTGRNDYGDKIDQTLVLLLYERHHRLDRIIDRLPCHPEAPFRSLRSPGYLLRLLYLVHSSTLLLHADRAPSHLQEASSNHRLGGPTREPSEFVADLLRAKREQQR